jgi:CBS domain-containing protein
MKALEVMTKDVVTVNPQTTVKEIAELMTEHRISGVPVVDSGGKLVGIVSETDLLHRAEMGTERRRKWWLSAFIDSDRLAREYEAAHGRKAADIMSTGVVTVEASTDLAEVADLLERRKVQRVPVMSDGKLIGILTKGDIVRALVARLRAAPAGAPGDAKALLAAINERMHHQGWLDTSLINVDVEGTVAELSGLVASADQRRALRVLVEETPGVSRVDDRMTIKPRTPMI